MDCTRRAFLTAAPASPSAPGWPQRRPGRQPASASRHRHRRPRPRADDAAQAAPRQRDGRGLRRLRAAAAAGRRDRRRRPPRRSPTIAGSSTTATIDAVVIGAPDHWHKTMTLDAVAAGKDVYVEKPVSHTIAEGAEMVQGHRSLEADRADRHAAAQLGSLRARQADHRLRPARPDHVRPDLLVSARDRRQLPAGRDRTSSIGSGGSARRPISRSGRSASTSGAISGTSAAAASPTS